MDLKIKTKLFKPGHAKSGLNDFMATHEILRVEKYPHARRAGLGNYVGVTYREEKSMDKLRECDDFKPRSEADAKAEYDEWMKQAIMDDKAQ